MGLFDRFTSNKLNASVIEDDTNENKGNPSSIVSEGGIQYFIIRPEVPFSKQFEYYRTVGKIQNSIDSLIDKIVTRDWYFASSDDAQPYEAQIKQLDEWARKYRFRWLLKQWMRNHLICGNDITSKKDWLPIQMSSIDGMVRDKYGRPEYYVQLPKANGGVLLQKYNAPDFLLTRYIELDRQAWGLGQFHAIMNDNWSDPDTKEVKSTLAGYRVMLQDFFKIIHKYGSPRVFYYVEGVSKEIIDNTVGPLIKRVRAGGRLVLDKKIEIVQETVDGQARFVPYVDKIEEEIETGSKSAANRLLTKPSAMADAGTADEQDDERSMAVMEFYTGFMNDEVIPIILGDEWRGKIEFHWGKQDSFEYDPQEWLEYVKNKIVSPLELRAILKENGGKLDDTLFQQHQDEQQAKQDQIMQQTQNAFQTKKESVDSTEMALARAIDWLRGTE
jgi:hypothetical protein